MAAMTEQAHEQVVVTPPARSRWSHPLTPLLVAVAVVLVGVLVFLVTSIGHSDAETRFLAAVQSDGITISDDAALQAGHDVCDGKPIDYITDANVRLIIAGEAFGQLC
jgi:hypothetical protein